jgi:hypothetical protein
MMGCKFVGIIHALVGDNSPVIPVTRYEYKWDFICVFFLFSILVTGTPLLLPVPSICYFLSTYFPCLIIFSEPSEDSIPSFPTEEDSSVELDRFFEVGFAAINLENLEF